MKSSRFRTNLNYLNPSKTISILPKLIETIQIFVIFAFSFSWVFFQIWLFENVSKDVKDSKLSSSPLSTLIGDGCSKIKECAVDLCKAVGKEDEKTDDFKSRISSSLFSS